MSDRPFDLSGLSAGPTADTATEPRRIFAALPARDKKYSYPRDVQSEVWEGWYSRRDARDLVIKMNTGGGKTVVGLLILKSALNEKVGPAAYVSPDIFLAEQVRAEAAALGLEVTDDPLSPQFRSGRSILVIHVHKLVNGLSVFGVRGSMRSPIEVGTLLIDDAHACLGTIEEQFTLSVPTAHSAYPQLIDLFADDLKAQTSPGYQDLVAGDRSAVIPIPYWAWIQKRDEVLSILHPHRDDEELKFVWPLLAESLAICKAAISADEVQAKPPCIPIESIPSIEKARRRLYLTATLADDSVLITHFGADPDSIVQPITPKTADDLGDRMILIPQVTHPRVEEPALRALIASFAREHNVVVIVPSFRRADLWKAHAVAVHDSKTIQEGVAALRRGHVGLVVLVNKYDGIDLPDDACRILVLDGLPEAYGALDRADELALENTPAFVGRQVQRIEQGMGRGVRSNDDYCVVFLLGSRLTDRIWRTAGISTFSQATRRQLDLSLQLSELLRDQPLESFRTIVAQCLSRDPMWVQAAKSALDGVTYAPGQIRPEAVAERAAFESGERRSWRQASDTLTAAASLASNRPLKGWLTQEAARYLHHADPVAAQALQHSALTENRGLLKPQSGTEYVRLSPVADQAAKCAAFLGGRYGNGAALSLGLHALLDDLNPDPDQLAVRRFEEAVHQLGFHLGFESQRPERDTGEGPDVLWSVGGLEYFVIECKSGTTTGTIAKRDAAQLGHSVDWFQSKYDASCKVVPFIIHASNVLHQGAYLREGTRIITFERVARLRTGVAEFATAIAPNFTDASALRDRLLAAQLNAGAIVNAWSVPPRVQR